MPLSRPAAACPNPLQGTDLWGGDLPGGTSAAASFQECCAKCSARKAECKAFTYVASWKKCYLKGAAGWAARKSWMKQSWAAPPSERSRGGPGSLPAVRLCCSS